jgi:hypothetical protein
MASVCHTGILLRHLADCRAAQLKPGPDEKELGRGQRNERLKNISGPPVPIGSASQGVAYTGL